MRVIEPRQLPKPKTPHPRHWLLRWVVISAGVILGLYVAVGLYKYHRTLPTVQAETKSVTVAPNLEKLNLPVYGQVAAGAVGYGELAKAGGDTPRPMASVAKVVTALVVLDKKPLEKDKPGPTITIEQADVDSYSDYISRNGSVVRVELGEQISQYQALQALLIPSSNNMADTLARWSFGSQDAFLKAANDYLSAQGLKNTTLADASGFSPKTVSTASDLVRLGELALKNPVIAEIAAQTSAVIPVAGTITNVNSLLGQQGIDGIKTGNTEEAGGCFLTTVLYKHASGNEVRLIVAVMGAGSLKQAMQDASQLLGKIQEDFGVVSIKAGTPVGFYNVPWSQRVTAITDKDVTVFRWQGTAVRSEVKLNPLKVTKNTSLSVGSVEFSAGPNKTTVGVRLNQSPSLPSRSWRFWEAVSP